MADLEGIIAASIKDVPGADVPAETTTDTTTVDTPEETATVEETVVGDIPSEPAEGEVTTESAEPADKKPAAKAQEDEDDLASIPQKEKNGRENRIPHSRVVKITENAVKKAVAQATTDFDVERKTHSDLQEKTTKLSEIMFKEPARFLEMLKKVDGYAPLLEAQTAKAEVVDPNDRRPEPDTDMGEGKKAYSPEGLDKLLEWNARKASRQAVSEAEKKFEARLSPFEKERKERETKERQHAEDLKVTQSEIEEMQDWEGFKENAAEIDKALQDDSKEAHETARKTGKPLAYKYKNVHAAYRAVVLPKLKADRARIRLEVMEELKKAPTSTSTSTRPVNAAVKKIAANSSEPRDLEEVIKESIAALK